MRKIVSVILVNYNGKEYNDKCIASILNSTIGRQIQIVVVDNASTDDSLELLKKNWGSHEQVKILSLDGNYGFSKANNEGIHWSLEQGIAYFLLLNNDTEIEPDAIERMLQYHQETRGIIVPKILYADKKDTIWCAGGSFSPIIRKAIQRGLNQIDKGQYDNSSKCGFANGCAMLLSKDILDKIGFLDERFFLYYEDTEYSMRAAEKDIGIWYCADAVVYHKVNGSTKGNEKPANAYYITRNWLLCNSLNMRDVKGVGKKLQFVLFIVYFICNRSAWLLIWFFQGKKEMCMGLLRGIRDFYRKKWRKYSY